MVKYVTMYIPVKELFWGLGDFNDDLHTIVINTIKKSRKPIHMDFDEALREENPMLLRSGKSTNAITHLNLTLNTTIDRLGQCAKIDRLYRFIKGCKILKKLDFYLYGVSADTFFHRLKIKDF